MSGSLSRTSNGGGRWLLQTRHSGGAPDDGGLQTRRSGNGATGWCQTTMRPDWPGRGRPIRDGDGRCLSRLDHEKRKDGGCGIRDELRVRERKPSSDTMLGISNLHYQGAKGHIYSTCIGHKYAENPLTDGENTIYNIHLTILSFFHWSTIIR
jgi:hypothetical protein